VSMANAIWMTPRLIRAPHLPRTTELRDMGEEASRRSRP
jgi:hypothetical protein